MSLEENKKLVSKYIDEIINTGNVDSISSFIAPDYTEVHDGKRYPIGIDGAKEHIIGIRKTYPDLKLSIDNQIAEGDWVATCITARGTHKGEWSGISATGKVLTYTGVNIDRIKDGKIIEHGGAANMLGPLLKVGAIEVVHDAS